MVKKSISRALSFVFAVLMTASAAGCSSSNSAGASAAQSAAPAASTASAASESASSKKVSLTFFSDLPDRSTGQGQLEQQMIDNFTKENPNVTVTVQSLQDDPYKQKFKTYVAANNLPDVFMVWGQPAFFQSIMEHGYAAELNKGDYDSYNFLPGSLDGFSLNGKLYGLPRNSDFMGLFYNSKILSDNGLQPPKSTSDFAAMAAKLKQKGISLFAIGGQEKWPLAIMWNDIVVKESGSDKILRDAFTKKDFSDPKLLQASTDFQKLATSGIFQASIATDKTADAQNLFAQGKAAMYYSGEWDMSMAANSSFSEDFRKNLKVMSFPTVVGGSGKITDIMGWNGGGYAVSAKSPNKDAAIALVNYIMKPDNWTKLGWEQGSIVPSQKFTSYMTGKETDVQKSLVNILSTATSTSGTPVNDSGSAQFKTDFETAVQQLATGMIKPDKFIQTLNDSVKANPVS